MNRFGVLAAILVVAGCGRPNDLRLVSARPMAGSVVSYGDCAEARRRAAAAPDLDVDRVPTPVRRRPAAFQRMPPAVKTVVDKHGAVVKVNVVVDTLGHVDMRTFEVVEASHPWFVANLRSVLPRWRFAPAEIAGCKVRRVYRFSATARPRIT